MDEHGGPRARQAQPHRRVHWCDRAATAGLLSERGQAASPRDRRRIDRNDAIANLPCDLGASTTAVEATRCGFCERFRKQRNDREVDLGDATLTHGAFTASIDRKCAMQDRKQRHAMCPISLSAHGVSAARRASGACRGFAELRIWPELAACRPTSSDHECDGCEAMTDHRDEQFRVKPRPPKGAGRGTERSFLARVAMEMGKLAPRTAPGLERFAAAVPSEVAVGSPRD